jgi:hypothetical protein
MNLHLFVDGNEIDLWQTPTHITNMCMMINGVVCRQLSGNEAKNAMELYFEWVRSTDDKKFAKYHIEDILFSITHGRDIVLRSM